MCGRRSATLVDACVRGDATRAKQLLARGAHPDGSGDIAPLHHIARSNCLDGQLECAKALIAAHASVDIRDPSGWTPLHRATESGCSILVALLLQAGASATAETLAGETPLEICDDCESLSVLLNYTSPNVHFPFTRRTPLMIATALRRIDLATTLLAKGAKPNAKSIDDTTALHIAAEHGLVCHGRILIAHGANVRAQDAMGDSPAHVAASFGHVDFLQLLKTAGADFGIRSIRGDTPAHEAARFGHVPCSVFLSKFMSVRNLNRCKPHHCAISRDHSEWLSHFIDGEDVRKSDCAFHAIGFGAIKCLEVLSTANKLGGREAALMECAARKQRTCAGILLVRLGTPPPLGSRFVESAAKEHLEALREPSSRCGVDRASRLATEGRARAFEILGHNSGSIREWNDSKNRPLQSGHYAVAIALRKMSALEDAAREEEKKFRAKEEDRILKLGAFVAWSQSI